MFPFSPNEITGKYGPGLHGMVVIGDQADPKSATTFASWMA